MIMQAHKLKGILFDLDGVLVDTATYHYRAWKALANECGIYFDETINERLKGVSRMASLEIILEKSKILYTQSEKEELCIKKNNQYIKMIETLTQRDVLPGVIPFLYDIKQKEIKCAVCSASKSAKSIIAKLGLEDLLDSIIDGNDVIRPKPDPEVFEQGYTKLGIKSTECVVFEDAFAGIEAAKHLGIKTVGIGEKQRLYNADYIIRNMEAITVDEIIEKFNFRG